MRYCRFQHGDGPRYGLIERRGEEDVIAALIDFDESGQRSSSPAAGFKPVLLSEAKLLAPVVPSKIICVGRNYRDHAAEMGNEVPKEPLIFYKPPSAIIGPNEFIELPPESLTKRVDYEGELGIVIGKRCRRLTEAEDALSYIRGYTMANDVTARDLQKTDSQWTRAKGFDTFCPVGPIVSDELSPSGKDGVELTTRHNGEQKQHGSSRDFIFKIDVVLRFITQGITLEPGDLVLTGTPAGVGQLKSGDTVEISIPGIGTLKNGVR